MIAPVTATSFHHAMRIGAEVYHALRGIIIERYGALSASVGDEGGFAPDLADVAEALELIMAAIKATGHQDVVRIALDVAASELAVKDAEGKAVQPFLYKLSPDDEALSSAQLLALYQELCGKFPIVSIEDGFHEDDWHGFAALTSLMGTSVQVVGDDLTVTNPARIARAVEEEACNALLLKVNQIGTVSEALRAAAAASNAGWNVMVSHRSGETEDTFIADLAVGLSCAQIKSGAPCRTERVAKYNQLLRIEEELGENGVYHASSVLSSQSS